MQSVLTVLIEQVVECVIGGGPAIALATGEAVSLLDVWVQLDMELSAGYLACRRSTSETALALQYQRLRHAACR